MMLLVNGAARDVERLKDSPRLGVLLTPNSHNSVERAVGWGNVLAADNGFFSDPDPAAFLAFLSKLLRAKADPRFVASPDVVGNAAMTLRKFAVWAPMIRDLGLPVALVLQDGMTVAGVPWGEFDAVFVGGTGAYKFSPPAVDICRAAKARGLWVHVGRCNSYLRIRAAAAMGADSIDGSQFSWWPTRYIPKGLRWCERAEREICGAMRQATLDGDDGRGRLIALAHQCPGTPGPLGQKRRREVSEVA